jgi:hypothetical protein
VIVVAAAARERCTMTAGTAAEAAGIAAIVVACVVASLMIAMHVVRLARLPPALTD